MKETIETKKDIVEINMARRKAEVEELNNINEFLSNWQGTKNL